MNNQNSTGEEALQVVSVGSENKMGYSQPGQNDSYSQGASEFIDLKGEIDRISNSTAAISRAVESLCQYNVLFSDEGCMELLNDIEEEEGFLFSQVPDYLKHEWKHIKSTKREADKVVEPRVDTVAIYNSEQRRRAENGSSCRLKVDPSIPLSMPFSKERHNARNPEYKSIQGNYHSLFFEDGEPVVFTPPRDNKRKELEKLNEERTYWKSKFKRPERNYDIQPKKPKVVPRDFVPSCAHVENVPAHRRPPQEKVVVKTTQ
ncbi:hypothetical protein LSM04_007254 [Trypanosoma melophagium]|uniref:uncharacterized protein n=1 Tax=Trypanosoma melophagium TaxID=715481 RepID=UPI003519FE27|nr:hypothetical protein LSM04_007254 [Trypanosoma melophagium]